MKRLKIIAMFCSFALIAVAFTSGVKADEYNKKTILTFSEPFEVPGVGAQILPAGTYVFKLVDSLSDRDIVQIWNADETHVYTTILAIPNLRLKPTDKTVLTFKERGEGQPEAIKAWFYPGDNYGQQFVYPKKRAIELAEIVNEPVLALPVETAVAIDDLKTVQIAAVQPTGEEVPVTSVIDAPPQAASATAPVETAETLPKTASSLPLFAMIGLLSLCAGFALMFVMKRSA